MTSHKQTSKYKVKEFEWFEMQTKVRQILQEILGPLQKRIMENSSQLNKIRFDQNQDTKRLEQISLMIANDPKVFEKGIFLTIQKKFEQQSKVIQGLSKQIVQAKRYIDQKFSILDIRMEQTNVVLQNVSAMKQRIAKEINSQNSNINSIRSNLEKMITDLNSDIRYTREIIQKNLELNQLKDQQLEQKIFKLQNKAKEMQEKLQNHEQMQMKKSQQLELHQQKLNDHKANLQVLEQSKDLTKKFCSYTKQLENDIKKFDFKLSTITPLITEAQIADCLYNVLPNKLKPRITIYQYKKYHHLNQTVLQNDFETISDRFHGLDMLEKMHKRCMNEIMQMKRKKLLSIGIDIDHLSAEQRDKYYREMSLQNTIEHDEQQQPVADTPPIDQAQILRILDMYYNSHFKNMSNKVNTELQHSKKFLYDMELELKRQLQGFQCKLTNFQKFTHTFQTQQLQQNNKLQSGLKSQGFLVEVNRSSIQQLKISQKQLYNFCSLVNHLLIQDQIDKQNISLMGFQENTVDNSLSNTYNENAQSSVSRFRSKLLQLDPKCFSCCGFPATTISSFKMACLAYCPSEIIIEDVKYRRQQLLEFTTNILQLIKGTINSFIKTANNQVQQHQPQQRHKRQLTLPNSLKQQQKLDNTFQRSSQKFHSNNKFRKTKKVTLSLNKNFQSRSTNRNQHSKQQIINASIAFNQLKKKNINFLN